MALRRSSERGGVLRPAMVMIGRGVMSAVVQGARVEKAGGEGEEEGGSRSGAAERLWAAVRKECDSQLKGARRSGMLAGRISEMDPETGRYSNELIYLQQKQIWGIITSTGRRPFLRQTYHIDIHEGPDSERVIHTVQAFPTRVYFVRGYRTILNVAFAKLQHDVKMKFYIPLKFSGRTTCPGLMQGGQLRIMKLSVSCYCFPDKIQQYIEVDVSKLNIGDKILVRDLNVDLRFKRQEDQVVCEIYKQFKDLRKRY